MGTGANVTLLNTRKMIRAERDVLMRQIELEPLKSITPYQEGFVAITASGRLVILDPAGGILDLTSEIKCLKVIGPKIYACSNS